MFRFVVSIGEAQMSIDRHFSQEVIEENEVALTEEEESELSDYLDTLTDIQTRDETDHPDSVYTEHMGKNLAGLAFVAGRSYQWEENKRMIEALADDLDSVEREQAKREQEEEDMVALRIKPQTAARLITFLLGED